MTSEEDFELDFIPSHKIVEKLISVNILDKIRADILRKSYEGYELGGFRDGYNTALVNVLNILDKYKAESGNSENPNKWIPITERLPEENGWYQCTLMLDDLPRTMELFYKNGKWLDNRRINMFDTYDIYGYGNTKEKHKLSYQELISEFNWTENVIAWMPLSQSYTAESEVRMSKCRHDSSKVCQNKDCFDCVLDKIKTEIRTLSPNPTTEDVIDDPIKDVVWKILADVLSIIRQHNIRKTEEVVKMRDATPEERESIDKYIKGISKPTGVDFDAALKQESEDKGMNVLDINFALDVLSHPQSADESDINTALKFAIESLKACRDGLTESKDMGEVSDGYHTFNQLYHQRAVLFAAIVNSNKDRAWKSFKHFDGEYCFDSNGEWFIVGVDTPEGSYTYHYSKEYWDMFKCKELERGKEWDGHTEDNVTRLLSLEK